jgi:SAM-dependent methyltransferase
MPTPKTQSVFKTEYIRGDNIPWSKGYVQAKERFIQGILSSPSIVEVFRNKTTLPEQFGVGIDERCVEYPWLMAHFQAGFERVLDAGSTLNYVFVLDHSLFRDKKLHVLTLAPENNCFWQKGVSYLYDDLRSIPIRDAYYDTVSCLSTLEHIGCDNTLFTNNEVHREYCAEDYVLVMQEFWRVLKPGGILFLTVPFGAYGHFGTFQQFDEKLLSRAIEAFGKTSEVTATWYRYTFQGWNIASVEDCAGCQYVDWVARAWMDKRMPDPLPVEPDLAAAARAVACVRLIKG